MDQTETKEGSSGTKKNKSKETDLNFPQEEAPHLGDCFDQAVWAINGQGLWRDYYDHMDAIVIR
jgi:hypothetical protein